MPLLNGECMTLQSDTSVLICWADGFEAQRRYADAIREKTVSSWFSTIWLKKWFWVHFSLQKPNMKFYLLKSQTLFP